MKPFQIIKFSTSTICWIICLIFEHKWIITFTRIRKTDWGFYRREFSAKCARCEKEIYEERMGFVKNSGSLTYFLEKYYI